MIYSDYHMHTSFSTDSDTPPWEMVEGAITKGLESICITDHYDADYPYYEDLGEDAFLFDPGEYIQTLRILQREYAEQIHIQIGIELGLQPHLGSFYQNLTKSYPFDFVIGSVHLIGGKDPYYREQLGNVPDRDLYRKAFETTLENLECNKAFDVLGHIDYVVRYGADKEKEYVLREYADILDEILKKTIYLGKGIELNTAGLRYGLPFCNPHPEILKRYRELGGEIITIGADGHKPVHIAYAFECAGDILRDCGFKYYTEYKARRAIFKQLP